MTTMDSATPAAAPMTWRRLLRDLLVAYGVVIVVAVVVAMIMGVDPEPFIYIPALVALAAGAWLSRGEGRGPVIAGLVVCLLTVFMTFWLIFGLFAFNTPLEFLVGLAFLLCIVVGIGVAIAALRRPNSGGERTRKVLMALAGIGVLVAIVGAFTAPNEDAEGGDIEIVAENLKFEPKTLTANAGKLSFHLDNHDPFTHDLSFAKGKDRDGDEVGKVGDDKAPGNKGARVERELAAGEYTYYCSIHSEMEGTLTVT
jgi:plastocyanin